MAFFNSKVAKFLLDDVGATQRDISPYITDIIGLPGKRQLDEVTALGGDGASFIPGVNNIKFSLKGLYNDVANLSPELVIGGLYNATAAADFEFHPVGTATPKPKWTGTCWVIELKLIPITAKLLRWEADFQVETVVTRGTN